MTFPSNYANYDTITIDHTKIGSGGLSNFDIWLPFSLLSSTAQSTLRNDGGDARFTLNDGTTRIAHDVLINASGNLAGFRINVPFLSDTDDTLIRCWYNGTDMLETAGSAYGQYATYPSVLGYWPLSNNPAGSAPQMQDRTANANHGTVSGGVTNTTGPLGDSVLLNGVNGKIDCGTDASLNPGTASFSLECWFNTTGTTGSLNYDMLMYKIKDSSPYTNFGVYIYGNAAKANATEVDGDVPDLAGAAAVNDGNWHHVAFVRDGANCYLYKDASLIASRLSDGGPYDLTNANKAFTIGDDSYNGGLFSGKICHVKFGPARSAAYWQTRFNNESNAASFFSDVTAFSSETGGGTAGTRRFSVIGSAIIRGNR